MDNWEQVEKIFHTALAMPPAERKPYLTRECAGDEKLRSDVESLIRSFETNSGFLDEPVFELGLGALGRKPETNYSGTIIGYYEIEEKIGTGGMGEVYKAFDTQLNRLVALKFLSESLEKDNSARRQLVKEAQAAAALEHPNICAVHGIEQTDEHHFIVMQYVEGITLSEKIAGDETIGVEEFKTLARQILSAVAFAHSHGIIHRDLKPGNIMLTADGQIKVLDFGLAKFVNPNPFVGKRNNTDTSIFSKKGIIIGTVSYMSPEQLRGEKLDYQSDIFSLGIILYELLTRQNPFHRPSQAETIAAILSENPVPLKDITPSLTTNLRELVEKCLQKNKNDRFESVAEMIVELNTIEKENPIKPLIKRRRLFLKSVLAAVSILILFSVFYILLNRNPQKSLAVLPFSIENSIKDKEYLADGLTHSISDELSEISELKVKSQTITARYKGKADDAQNIGKELTVDAVLTGEIRKRTDGIYLEIKLIRTTDGIFVDKTEFPLDETRLNEIQEKISNRIIEKAKFILSDEDKLKLAKKDTSSDLAKNLYLQGRFFLKRRKETDDIEKATKYFFDAKEIDQNYAKAWAGLADAYLSQAAPGVKGAIPPQKAYESAKIAANKAIELDNTLAESYTSLGWIDVRYEWNWKSAENNFRTAIDRDPEFLPARFGLIRVLNCLKRDDEALEVAKKIKEFDPFSINSDVQIALIYYRKKDFQQAEQILSELNQRFPDNRTIKYPLAYLFLNTNRPQKAVEIVEPIYQTGKDEDRVLAAAPLGFAFAKLGRRTDALKIITELNEIRSRIYVPAQEEALIYVGLGDYDKAFEKLKQSCAEKYSSLPNWITDPIVDEIQIDSRFNEIIQCVKL